ncbi:hypothetical protein HK104_007940 [Borealophlyctis nickersoniae]|nr:hypothetical protein HK104_007940 [Borealophlyctis nickersoniae]
MPTAPRPSLSHPSYKAPTTDTVIDEGVPQSEKERDAREKLKTLEYFRTQWDQGNLPSNAEIDKFLASLQDAQPITERKEDLSADGRRVLEDLSLLIQETRRFVAQKNEGEVLQKFVQLSKDAGKQGWQEHGGKVKAATANTKENTKQAREAAKKKGIKEVAPPQAVEVYSRAATVAKLLVSSPRFRELLSEIISLSHYFLAGVAEKSASTLRERGDAQKQATITNGHADELQRSSTLPPVGTVPQIPPVTFDKDKDSTVIPNPASAYPNSVAPAVATGSDPTALKTGTASKTDAAAVKTNESINKRISPETQEKVKAQAAAAKNAAVDVFHSEIPDEKRRELENKLRALIREIQSNPEYQSAIEYLFETLSEASNKTTEKVQSVQTTASSSTSTPVVNNLTEAHNNLRTFIERLASNHSLTPLTESLSTFRQILRDDQDLRGHVDTLKTFTQRSLREPGFIDRDSWRDEGSNILDRIRAVLDERYAPQRDVLRQRLNEFVDAMRADQGNQRVAEAGARLNRDLFKDAEGNFAFKTDLIADLKDVIFPILIQKFRFIPVPKIVVDTPELFLSLDNIILTTQNILPNMIETQIHNAVVVGLPKSVATTSDHKVTIGLYQMQAKIDDIKFEIQRKKGFPTIKDSGLAAVKIGRNGITLHMTLNLHPTSRTETLTLTSLTTHIDTLTIKLSQTRHDALYALAIPLVKSRIKAAVVKAVEKNVREQIKKLDANVTRAKGDPTTKGKVGGGVRLSGLFGGSRKQQPVEEKKEKREHAVVGGLEVKPDEGGSAAQVA